MIWFSVGLLVLWIGGGFWARRVEKKEWNGGRCPKCKSVWKHFDTDSQGGRMYHCYGCTHPTHCDISYPGVDR